MKIAILGAGFTGLTAAYRLLQQGHQVYVFEKENIVGGLAGGFKSKGWGWTLEKSYHHLFTNDYHALKLAQELNHQVIIKRPKTNVFINGAISQLDSPLTLMTFTSLPILDRLKIGLTTLYLKLNNNYHQFEKTLALSWIRKYMGVKSAELIWEPLFEGKFGSFKEKISLVWFWTRIKKRTPFLAYPEGGFLSLAQNLASKVKQLGGEIVLGAEVSRIQADPQNSNVILVSVAQPESKQKDPGLHQDDPDPAESEARPPRRDESRLGLRRQIGDDRKFDKVIVTLPSPVFTKIAPELPADYKKRLSSIQHLWAQNLILILNKPFMADTYWLNITDTSFPFLVLAEHTNFMDPIHYGNQYLLYIGNYLPEDHPYLKMSAEKLLEVFNPYLKKINPSYLSSLVTTYLFSSPFAQPIITTDYSQKIPSFITPLKNIYLANLDMVYPWDRGTNYAIEMGEKIANLVRNK